MARLAAALLLTIAALIAAWFGAWGMLIVGWMASATAADMAWRFIVALFAFALIVAALGLFALACVVVAPVVRRVYGWLSDDPATK